MDAQATTKVGQLERKTQNRIVGLFRDRLGYDYLGNWEEREANSNVEEKYLRDFLVGTTKYSERVINKAIADLKRAAGKQNVSLYDLNKETYGLLRYGAKVREELGKHRKTVWLIDWEHPENNHF